MCSCARVSMTSMPCYELFQFAMTSTAVALRGLVARRWTSCAFATLNKDSNPHSRIDLRAYRRSVTKMATYPRRKTHITRLYRHFRAASATRLRNEPPFVRILHAIVLVQSAAAHRAAARWRIRYPSRKIAFKYGACISHDNRAVTRLSKK
jgi:hypothetical protein